MTAAVRAPDRTGRSSGFVYTGLGMVLLVLVAAITFTASQAPPPAIAEVAPSAVQQIKDAPDDQSSDFGSADGGGGDGTGTTTTSTPVAGGDGAAATTSTTEPTIVRPRVRRCVGNPPRQIDDPQSPPCVPYWDGDNGGATSYGVTKDTIVVTVPNLPGAHDRLQTFLNKRFEFYGRTLLLQPIITGGTCELVKSGAVGAKQQNKAFGSLSIFKQENCYMEELARLKMVGVGNDTVFTSAQLQAMDPYIWQYPMSIDDLMTGLGQWACARLAGANARFAEGVNTQTGQAMSLSRRRFGLIVQPYATGHPLDTAPLNRALGGCGESLASTFVFPDADQGAGPSTNAVLQMKTEGVTDVVCFCGSFSNLYLPAAANSQSYYPEWLVSSYGLSDANFFVKSFWADAGTRANLMGLTIQPRQWTYADTPLFWAIKEADPNYEESADTATAAGNAAQWNRMYRMLLVLASGIQLAGPNLTPETFAQALKKTQFPNPATGLQAGRVGFGSTDHAFTNDFAEMYWSDVGTSPLGDGPGTMCYVDGGTRRTPGRWPSGDAPLFSLPCDSGTQRAQNPT